MIDVEPPKLDPGTGLGPKPPSLHRVTDATVGSKLGQGTVPRLGGSLSLPPAAKVYDLAARRNHMALKTLSERPYHCPNLPYIEHRVFGSELWGIVWMQMSPGTWIAIVAQPIYSEA